MISYTEEHGEYARVSGAWLIAEAAESHLGDHTHRRIGRKRATCGHGWSLLKTAGEL